MQYESNWVESDENINFIYIFSLFAIVVSKDQTDPAIISKEKTQTEKNGAQEDKPKALFGSRNRVLQSLEFFQLRIS